MGTINILLLLLNDIFVIEFTEFQLPLADKNPVIPIATGSVIR